MNESKAEGLMIQQSGLLVILVCTTRMVLWQFSQGTLNLFDGSLQKHQTKLFLATLTW
jgi:hypothetical protein